MTDVITQTSTEEAPKSIFYLKEGSSETFDSLPAGIEIIQGLLECTLYRSCSSVEGQWKYYSLDCVISGGKLIKIPKNIQEEFIHQEPKNSKDINQDIILISGTGIELIDHKIDVTVLKSIGFSEYS